MDVLPNRKGPISIKACSGHLSLLKDGEVPAREWRENGRPRGVDIEELPHANARLPEVNECAWQL